MAVVAGRLQMRNWTDKDGNKRTSAEIVADNIYFGDSKREDSGDTSNAFSNPISIEVDMDEELPF